jgi:hypothetical protein
VQALTSEVENQLAELHRKYRIMEVREQSVQHPQAIERMFCFPPKNSRQLYPELSPPHFLLWKLKGWDVWQDADACRDT